MTTPQPSLTTPQPQKMAAGCAKYLPRKGCLSCQPRTLKSHPPDTINLPSCSCEDGHVGLCPALCTLMPQYVRPPNQRCVRLTRKIVADEALTPNIAPIPQWVTVGYHLQPPNQVKVGYVHPAVRKRQLKQCDGMLVPKQSEAGDVMVQCAKKMGKTKPLTCFLPTFTEQYPSYAGSKRKPMEAQNFLLPRTSKRAESIIPFPPRECFQALGGSPQGHQSTKGPDRSRMSPSPTEKNPSLGERVENDVKVPSETLPGQSKRDWSPCDLKKPFWYLGSQKNPKRPVGNLNDYAFCKLRLDKTPNSQIEDLELDEVRNYIPGEVACARREKTRSIMAMDHERSAGNHLSILSNAQALGGEPPSDCPAPLPLYTTMVPRIRPPDETLVLDPWIGSDVQQFSRVGRSYKSAIIKALYDTYPPIKYPFKPPKFSI